MRSKASVQKIACSSTVRTPVKIQKLFFLPRAPVLARRSYSDVITVEDSGSVEEDEGHILPSHSLFQWKAILADNVKQGKTKRSLQLLQQMQAEGIILDKGVYLTLLKAYAKHSALAEGRLLHALIKASPLHSDVALGNALINMYSKANSLEDAERIFHLMSTLDVISWNSMITACTRHRQGIMALDYFEQMQVRGVEPDHVTFVSMLSACTNLEALLHGMYLHNLVIRSGFESVLSIQNALSNMYGKCGSLVDARCIFYKSLQEDIISWNCMISNCAHDGAALEALELLGQMLQRGTLPNDVTLISTLSAISAITALSSGRRVHSCIVVSDFYLHMVVCTCLISMYGKCGSTQDAQKVFDVMPERNVVSWNAMIAAYTQSGQRKQAFQLFQDMQRDSILTSSCTFLTILDACRSKETLSEVL